MQLVKSSQAFYFKTVKIDSTIQIQCLELKTSRCVTVYMCKEVYHIHISYDYISSTESKTGPVDFIQNLDKVSDLSHSISEFEAKPGL